MTADLEVHIDLGGHVHRVGAVFAPKPGAKGAIIFEYDEAWLGNPVKFALEPAMQLGRGAFAGGPGLMGSIGDSAPDTWGRRLMQRAERRRAQAEGRKVRTLTELDYLIGVSDIARLGALRLRTAGDGPFQAVSPNGVPCVISLGKLLGVTQRIEAGEESDEDINLIFAPGSSLGGARPKASVIDTQGALSIAKFAKADDDYNIELWEAVAIDMARAAGISTAQVALKEVAGTSVLLSKRFDRDGENRIPFLSALSMMDLKDGATASYPELADVLTLHGSQCAQDAAQLYRRMIFNILISNVDDHLRNHGFLLDGSKGWILSPAYDLNPVPQDVRPRILSTNIDIDDASCDLDLALSVSSYFGLGSKAAKTIISEVGMVTGKWRTFADKRGAKKAAMNRMASAFEHEDLARAHKMG